MLRRISRQIAVSTGYWVGQQWGMECGGGCANDAGWKWVKLGRPNSADQYQLLGLISVISYITLLTHPLQHRNTVPSPHAPASSNSRLKYDLQVVGFV